MMRGLPDHLAELSLRADRDAIRSYAELTGDMNPIHIDPAFAATTAMGGIIAHGTMSLSLIWQALAQTIGADPLDEATLEAKFLLPVRCDDLVTVGGLQRAGEPGVYDVWARTSDTVTVIEGVARLSAGEEFPDLAGATEPRS